MFWIAVMAMTCAVLAQHLGLAEAVSDVLSKIAKCPMCCSMWVTLAALLHSSCDIVLAVALSVIMSYLSNYFGILLIELQRLYLWLRNKTEK